MGDLYRGSAAAAILSGSPDAIVWMFIDDLDGTLADKHTTDNEIVARFALLDLIESVGGISVFSTARTPELLMSSGAYAASCDQGFTRPRPKYALRDGARRYVPLEDEKFFSGLLDPHVMNCFGTGIFLRHGDGYREDLEYRGMLGDESWRTHAAAFLAEVDLGIESHLATIERDGAYERDEADVAPLPFRMELRFSDEATCTSASERIMRMRNSMLDGILGPLQPAIPRDFIKRLALVDESNPVASSWQRYLVPQGASKENGIMRILQSFSGMHGRRLRIFVAGDTMTDLPSMLDAVALGGVAVLAGKSRLAPSAAVGTFFEETIPRIIAKMEEIGRGVYRDPASRGTFIVADEAFPRLRGAESVYASAKRYFSDYHE